MCVRVFTHTLYTYVHTPCLYVSFFDSFVYFVFENGPLFLLPFLDFFPLHLAPSTMILHFNNHSHPFVTKRNTIQNDLSTIQHITRAYTHALDRSTNRPLVPALKRVHFSLPGLIETYHRYSFVRTTNYVILLIEKRTWVEQENCSLCIRAGKQRRD